MKEQLMTIMAANGAVLIVPGLNFTLLTRYALQSGLSAAIQCTLGVTLAIAVHVICSMFGSYQLLTATPKLLKAVQIAGAFYIFYLATTIFARALKNKAVTTDYLEKIEKPLVQGLMIDLLNPFVTIFYISLFASLMRSNTTAIDMFTYLGFILTITFVWFSLVSIVFSRAFIRDYFLRIRKVVELISAGILYYYGQQLLFTT
ncbi:LysE family translocator [Legionella londiniensis]|uniref:Transporter n=1 Tax=Legionella londiniensis TaxID=45068 RepID=A0A0W0VS12_9GAMM|nr:LysE family translocator [Legionella londiniensis]KTD22849.1 transporter [Legionella londiniensis]STX92714.1 transporter [Legionella londiniensis]